MSTPSLDGSRKLASYGLSLESNLETPGANLSKQSVLTYSLVNTPKHRG